MKQGYPYHHELNSSCQIYKNFNAQSKPSMHMIKSIFKKLCPSGTLNQRCVSSSYSNYANTANLTSPYNELDYIRLKVFISLCKTIPLI